MTHHEQMSRQQIIEALKDDVDKTIEDLQELKEKLED